MFRLNAFGQRIICNPYLRFVDPPEGGDPAGGGTTPPPAPTSEQLGFPVNTPVAEMKPEEQAAYWRNESKKHQRDASSRADYDSIKAERDRLKNEHASAEDRALEDARREGENIGSEKYLAEAVKGRFQAITKKTDEEVDTAFAHVDPKSFLDDKGVIDAAKIKSFAEVFGKSDNGNTPPADPVAAAMAARRTAGGGSSSSSRDRRKETREKLLPSSKA